MKYLVLLLFTFSLAAVDLQTVEQLFAAGEFAKCGKAVDELLNGKVSEKLKKSQKPSSKPGKPQDTRIG